MGRSTRMESCISLAATKFTQQHFNAIAKDFREQLARYPGNSHDSLVARGALVALAIRMVQRFKDDNPRFEPLKFLAACSPDNELYPLQELWEDETIRERLRR
jgi:hypothetical protein